MGQRLTQRNTNEEKRGQRSRRYRHKNKKERRTEPETEQRGKTHRTREPNKQPTTPNGAAALITTQRTRKKQCFNNGTSKSLFNNSPVCVESQHTRVRVGARSVYQERNERKKKTRRARKKERKKKRKEERKRA